MKIFRKQPKDRLDYDILFHRWMPKGDAIASVDIDTPEGITFVGSSNTEDAVKVWVRGGESGNSYPFALRITTEQGRIKEVDFMIVVVEI